MGLQNILEGYQCGTVYKPIYAGGPGRGGARALPPGGQEAAGERCVNGTTNNNGDRRCRRCC